MQFEQRYAFVIDIRGVQLSPMKWEKAWFKVRHGKAEVVTMNPFTVKLLREQDNTDESIIHVGIDPGQISGIVIIQEGKESNKVIFKGEIEHRQDVSKRMITRLGYRRIRRKEKRYRESRFNNRSSSKRLGRIPPSIKTSKDEILRILKVFLKRLKLDKVHLENVLFDIRCLTDGYKSYKWEYQKSNRLDENLRKAVLVRDGFTCKKCNVRGVKLEVHHIISRRDKGEDTVKNLITLCENCHVEVTGKEKDFEVLFFSYTGGSFIGLSYAVQVMQGKTYLETNIKDLVSELKLVTGGDTANRRIDLGYEKSHVNDAKACVGLIVVDNTSIVLIKPQRKRRQVKVDNSLKIVQGDRVLYLMRDGRKIEGIVTAIGKSECNKGKYIIKELKTKRKYGPISMKNLKLLKNRSSIEFVS